MMIRPKTRKQPWLVISGVTILTLAVLSGAVFFLLPKLTAASAHQSIGPASNSAQPLNTTNTTGTSNIANKVSNTNTTSTINKTGQTTPQSTQTTNTTTTNGTTIQPTPTTGATNGNQTTTQNTSLPLVTLKQYVPNIRHLVAQNLNITDKALAQQLQSGMHLKDIAMQHGLTNTQLENLLSSSISLGFLPAINAGNLTQMQVSSFIQQTQVNPTTLEQQLSILPAAVAHW